MRLLIVSQYFHPENFRINDLAQWLVQQGHEVCVLTGIPNYPEGRFFDGYGLFRRRRENWKGVNVVRVPQVPRGRGGGLRLALNYVSFALFGSLLGPLRIHGRFDAIFVHEPSPITVGIPAIVMRKRLVAPIYFWVLDLWPESVAAAGGVRADWLLDMLARLTRWIYRHCEKVLVQSRAFVPKVEAMGVSPERVAYFPNWAEETYRASSAEQLPVPLPTGFRIMYAGNIGAAQDFSSILDAAGRLQHQQHVQWIIVGDGREVSWVRQEVKRRRLEATVHLIGSFPAERMAGFFAQADAMLVSLKPDPVFSLTIPAKVQAYMASGRPILAMLDGEGARVIEESGSGYTCRAGDSVGLAENVLKMSRLDSAVRAGMGAMGREYCEMNFDRETLFRQLVAWMTRTNDGNDTAAPAARERAAS